MAWLELIIYGWSFRRYLRSWDISTLVNYRFFIVLYIVRKLIELCINSFSIFFHFFYFGFGRFLVFFVIVEAVLVLPPVLCKVSCSIASSLKIGGNSVHSFSRFDLRFPGLNELNFKSHGFG